jgi:hypothetical protein
MRRGREVARVVEALVAEAVVLAVLWAAAPVLGTVDYSQFGAWLHTTSPTSAITAVARLAGMVTAAWLLVSTLVYLVASLAGAEGLVRRSGWVTLPWIRRIVDGVAAASILASTMAASGSGFVASGHTATVTRPLIPPRPANPEASPTTIPHGAQPRMVTVDDQTIGRHLPHPGVLDHPLPIVSATPIQPVTTGVDGLSPGTKMVVVQPGDCLSVIAQRHLGDWRLDTEIHALNAGRIQPDGRALTDDHWIYPGWVLVMPVNAVDTQTVPQPAPAAAQAVTPAVSPATPAPSPAAAAPSVVPAPPTSLPVSPPETPTAPTIQSPAPASHPAPPAPSVAAGPAGRVPAMPPAPRIDQSSHRNGDPTMSWPVELAGAGVLCFGVVALLTKLTRIQAGRRRPGRSIPRPNGAQARVELAARVAADPDMAALVDRGLRYLASQLSGHGQPVPAVLGVEVNGSGLVVLLAEAPTHIPDGFTAGTDGFSWAITATALEEFAVDVDDIVPPLPGLVTLGHDYDTSVMVNLGAAGVVTVDGDQHVAREVVAAAAVELATAAWSPGSQILLVGFGHTDGLGRPEPVELVGTVDECLNRLRAKAQAMHDLVDDAQVASLDELRLAGTDTVDLGPSIVICLEAPSPESTAELVDLASDPANGLSALIAAGGSSVGWTLDIAADGMLEIGPLARRVVAQRLPLPVLDTIEDRIAVASLPDDVDTELPVEDWWEPDAHLSDGADLPDVAGHNEDLAGSDLEETDDESASAEAESGSGGAEPSPTAIEASPAGPQAAERLESDGVHASFEPGTNGGPALAQVVGDGDAGAGQLSVPVIPPEAWREGIEPEILVQVLQPTVQVVRLTGPDAGKKIKIQRTRSMEIVAYLALHKEGVSRNRLAQTIHPEAYAAGRTPNTGTFSTELNAARKALGKGATGKDHMPAKSGDSYKLNPTIVVDATVIERLGIAAEKADSDAGRSRLLTAAFSLVGDQRPLSKMLDDSEVSRRKANENGHGSKPHWQWFDVEFAANTDRAIVDIALGLAEVTWGAGDPREAAEIASKGLEISPLSDPLWKLLLTVEAERGSRYLQAVNDKMRRIHESEAEPYDSISDELLELSNQLLARRGG